MKKITFLLLALICSVTTWADQWKAGDAQTPVAGTDYLLNIGGNLLTSSGAMTSIASDRTFFWQLEEAGDGNYYVKNDNGYLADFTADQQDQITDEGLDPYDIYNYAGFNASLTDNQAEAMKLTVAAVEGGYTIARSEQIDFNSSATTFYFSHQGNDFGVDPYGACTLTFCTAEEYVPFVVANGKYTFQNKRSGNYATWTGDASQMSQSSLSLEGVWTITANGDGSYKLGNYKSENYYAGHSSFTAEGAKVYILQSEYNEGYVVVSLTSDASDQCWDDQTGKVGYWHPSADDNQGTSWWMTAITDEEIAALVPEEFVAPSVAAGYVPQVSSEKATAIESGKFYVVKGFDQANGVATGYLCNEGGSVKATTTLTADNNYVWYVQQRQGDVMYMYNVAAQKFVTMGTSSGSAISFAESGAYVQFTAGDGVWAIKNSTCDQWIDFGWYGTGLSSWGGGVAGSRRAEFYEVEYVDPNLAAANTLSDAIAAATAQGGTNPGWKSASDIKDLTDAAEAALTAADRTIESLTQATTTLNDAVAALAYIMPAEGKLYQIVSALPGYEAQQGVQKALYVNGSTLSWKTISDEDAAMIWTLTPVEGGYAMKNNFTSAYPGVQESQSGAYPTSTEATVTVLTTLGAGQFNIKTTGSGYAMHTGGHSSGAGKSGNIVAWDGAASTGSAWYIVETSADEAEAARNTFATLQGHETFLNVEGAVIIKADEIPAIATINAAIEAVNAIDPETATVAEMGACYAANAATINSLSAYGTLTDIVYTLKPGFGTLCLPCWGGYGTLTTDEFQAYTCSAIEGKVLTLTETASMAPKTPFIVENKTAEDIVFEFIGWNKLDGEQTTFDGGLLTGTVEDMDAPEGSYVLQNHSGEVAFYLVGETVPTVGAYHAYLNTQSDVKAIYFPGSGVETAISSVKGETAAPAAIFNIAGQRVSKAEKGIFIVNGKKVMK